MSNDKITIEIPKWMEQEFASLMNYGVVSNMSGMMDRPDAQAWYKEQRLKFEHVDQVRKLFDNGSWEALAKQVEQGSGWEVDIRETSGSYGKRSLFVIVSGHEYTGYSLKDKYTDDLKEHEERIRKALQHIEPMK